MATRDRSQRRTAAVPELGTRSGDLAATAYERLRDLILEGRVRPGQRLTQRELIDQLGVGRTPLREALRMLETDGYLVSEAHYGVTVASPELADVEELYVSRLLLEPPLLAGCAERLSDADLAEMAEHLEGMRASQRRHRVFHQTHTNFHLVLKALYGPVTRDLILDLYRRVYWVQRVYMSRQHISEDFLRIDEELLAALVRRESFNAKRLLEFHIIDSAIGMILDVEPDHRFSTLIAAAYGIGIEIETTPEGTIDPPTAIRWADGSSIGLSTPNLKTPAHRRGGRKGAASAPAQRRRRARA